MPFIKFNRNRFPSFSDEMKDWMDTDGFFSDDFFVKNRNLPAMNVKENKDNFELELAVPGFSKNEIDVTMENDILQVTASKSVDDVQENDNYMRKEFSYNSFERALQIPATVNQEQEVNASYTDGILTLILQKEAEVKESPKKRIEIA